MPDRPCVVVKGGPTDGAILYLEKVTIAIVGSGTLAHLKIPVKGVSSAHLKIHWDDAGIFATDNDSFTGTFVNGMPIVTAPLRDNDRIAFAPTGKGTTLPKLLVRIPPGMVIALPPQGLIDPSMHPRDHPPATERPPERTPTAQPTPSGAAHPRASTAGPVRAASRAPRLQWPPSVELTRPVLLIALIAVVILGLGLVALVWSRFFHQTAPVISTIAPQSVAAGQIVTIEGSGFASRLEDNKVLFDAVPVAPLSSEVGRLTVRAPLLAGREEAGVPVKVAVEASGRRSAAVPLALRIPPSVTGLEPDLAAAGDELSIQGQVLSAVKRVTIAGMEATVLEAQPRAVRVRVPDLPAGEGQTVKVVVEGSEGPVRPLDLVIGHAPALLRADPPRAAIGERVKLAGRGFAADLGGNAVTFGGAPALALAAAPHELSVLVPVPLPGSSDAPVWQVATAGHTSGTVPFTLAGTTGAYLLRFTAVPDQNPGRVWISSALGPVLLLSSADGAASVADRAASAASALNDVVVAHQSDPSIAFVARSQPPAIAVGTAEPVLRVTDADAAEYERLAGRSGRGSAAAVAAHGAALLDDYLDLAVSRRRPLRMLGTSPRGRAMVDLQTRIGWRAGAPINAAALANLDRDSGERLRALALAPGSVGGPVSAAVVEGTWEGQMQDADSGEYRVALRLTIDGQRISGTVRRGPAKPGMSAQIPVRDAVLRGWKLEFTAALGGGDRTFVGEVTSEGIAGNVLVGGRPVGPFSLRYVE